MQNDLTKELSTNLIDYIEKRISEQKFESKWLTNHNDELRIDLGYVAEWWFKCMKPELEEVFND